MSELEMLEYMEQIESIDRQYSNLSDDMNLWTAQKIQQILISI